MTDDDLKADLQRYPPRPFLKEQSIWAVWVYRFGRRALMLKPGANKRFRLWLYWWMFHCVEVVTGISIDADAIIGPGLRIFHFGNIFIHGRAVIGANCTLRQGVTIGCIGDDGPALASASGALQTQMRAVPGFVNPYSTSSLRKPEVIIAPDTAKAAELGVTTTAIAQAIDIATLTIGG